MYSPITQPIRQVNPTFNPKSQQRVKIYQSDTYNRCEWKLICFCGIVPRLIMDLHDHEITPTSIFARRA